MSFTPVIPSSYNTDRQDLFAALEVLIDAFIADVDFAVGRKFLSEVPETLTGEGPLIVIGDVNETIVHTMQMRITTFRGSLIWIDWLTENNVNRAAVWADHMRDLLTYNAQITGKGELHERTLVEGELGQGRIIANAPTIGFDYVVQEGYR